jgi:hypothetical protein
MVVGRPRPRRAMGAPCLGVLIVMLSATGDPGGGLGCEATALADLARHQELVVVYGLGAEGRGLPGVHALVTSLRALLSRQSIVAVLVDDHPNAAQQEFATIAGLIQDGAVAVAVALAADPLGTARLLAKHLGADPVQWLGSDGQLRPAIA